jgi:long-chain fatty acid transport protein
MAQTNERTYEAIGFRVVTPGARAVAMGKTFIGIADDATAAASNPAGLSNLLDPEVSFEWSGTTQRQTRMRDNDPLLTETTDITFGYPSFASFVTPLPFEAFKDVTVGALFNTLQATKEAFDLPNEFGAQRGYRGDISISGYSMGGAASWLVSRKLSIGGALTRRYLHNSTNSYAYPGGNKFNVRNGSETDSSDWAWGGQLGMLLKPTRQWSFGAAFLIGSTFDLKTTLIGRYCPENCPNERGEDTSRPVSTFLDPVQGIQYRIPTRLTGGVSLRPNSSFLILADVGWIRYSERITPEFLIVDFLGQLESSGLKRSLYHVNDAIELHGGLEYRFVRRNRVWAIRCGAFADPEHQMRFDYEASNKSGQARAQDIQFNMFEPGTAYGLSGGAGVVLANRFQLDGAVSYSRNATDLVLSFVWRFPR